MAIEFKVQLQRINSELWQYLFSVPNEIAKSFIEGDNRRVICTVEGRIKYHCALMPDGKGGYFILLNQSRRTELGIVLGETFQVKLEKDTSELGMPISDELMEAFDQFPEAKVHFENFTPGRKRTLIYWVDNVKSSEIKIRRALVLMNHLIEKNGEADFKELNSKLKVANQKAK